MKWSGIGLLCVFLVGCQNPDPTPPRPSPAAVVRDASLEFQITSRVPVKVQPASADMEVETLPSQRFRVRYPRGADSFVARPIEASWGELLQNATPEAALRLSHDSGMEANPRTLSVRADDGRGFGFTLAQLWRHKVLRVPLLHVVVSMDTVQHAAGQTTRQRVQQSPEATLSEYRSYWDDLGRQHVIPLAWDGGAVKFGVDALGAVRTADDALLCTWDMPPAAFRSQALERGLPIVLSRYEHDSLQFDIEHYVDANNVLVQNVTVRNLTGQPRDVSLPLRLASLRKLLVQPPRIVDEANNPILHVQGLDTPLAWAADLPRPGTPPSTRLNLPLRLPPHGHKQIVVTLLGDSAQSRADVVGFWEKQLERGARFEVPEAAVNELFRANLWHAMRNSYRVSDRIDMPYSTFGYSQSGIPWPQIQAVLVDNAVYDLRGYHDLSRRELTEIYRVTQQSDGRIGGFKEWFVNTPGLIVAACTYYRLSGDEAGLREMLPDVLRSADWLKGEMSRDDPRRPTFKGMLHGPFTDMAPPGYWAFNQAWSYAALSSLADVLQQLRHERAAEFRDLATRLQQSIERACWHVAARSPVSQIGDGTWVPVVQSELSRNWRDLTTPYPNEVDAGPLHLLALQALDAKHPLAEALLDDSEDNLFYRSLGVANEPVYCPQGHAYLMRDEPEMAIRTFYSTMACGFSHQGLESVEHRWGFPQVFGPPSTDGGWFALYRNMLVNELQKDTLFIGQAPPRAWLQGTITVERAPTWYGPVSFTLQQGRAEVALTRKPATLLVRLRDPARRTMRGVRVNGRAWRDFDGRKEWVRIDQPAETRYRIDVQY